MNNQWAQNEDDEYGVLSAYFSNKKIALPSFTIVDLKKAVSWDGDAGKIRKSENVNLFALLLESIVKGDVDGKTAVEIYTWLQKKNGILQKDTDRCAFEFILAFPFTAWNNLFNLLVKNQNLNVSALFHKASFQNDIKEWLEYGLNNGVEYDVRVNGKTIAEKILNGMEEKKIKIAEGEKAIEWFVSQDYPLEIMRPCPIYNAPSQKLKKLFTILREKESLDIEAIKTGMQKPRRKI